MRVLSSPVIAALLRTMIPPIRAIFDPIGDPRNFFETTPLSLFLTYARSVENNLLSQKWIKRDGNRVVEMVGSLGRRMDEFTRTQEEEEEGRGARRHGLPRMRVSSLCQLTRRWKSPKKKRNTRRLRKGTPARLLPGNEIPWIRSEIVRDRGGEDFTFTPFSLRANYPKDNWKSESKISRRRERVKKGDAAVHSKYRVSGSSVSS